MSEISKFKSKFKVGDRVKYESESPELVDIGTVDKRDDHHFTVYDNATGYYIKWEKHPQDSGWYSENNRSIVLITEPTVKSAIEAKIELEKKILSQIQEYNKAYGMFVSDINIRQHSGVQYISQDAAKIVRNISVEIEVKF